MRRRIASMAIVVASLALSGCALDLLRPSGGPDTTFDLTAPVSFPESLGSSGSQLLIPPPDAVGVVASDRIAIRQEDAIVTVLSDAQWQTDLPQLLQSRLVETFQRSGHIRAVGRPGESILSNYQLLVDIRAFEVDAETNTAKIDLFCRLMNDRDGRILATAAVTATAPAPTEDAEGYVSALNAAFERAALDILDFTLDRI